MDIDKYKQGKLTEEELDIFTGELVRAKFNQSQKDKWAKKLAIEHQIQRDLSTAKVVSFPYRKWTIAATALLLLALIPLFRNYFQPAYLKLADNYLENELFLPDLQRGASEETISDLRKTAIQTYTNQDYQAASSAYEAILNSNFVKNEDYLFAGLSCLYDGNKTEAVKKLEIAQAKIKSGQAFSEETNWFLSLAYLKNGDLEKARQKLNNIVNKKGFYSDQAQKILSTL